MSRLGLIAGGGGLPVEIATACQQAGRPLFVVRLKGFAGVELAGFPGADIGIAELGKCMRALQGAGCESICFAGQVNRPDFAALRPDVRGLKALPGLIAAARHGDDGLLRALLQEFEKEGFRIEGADEALGDLRLPLGVLGRISPEPRHHADIARALHVAREMGRMDIGQGTVVCEGLVLAVEAQEGTDALRGVLAKAPKPIQETRVDLPTIGLATIQRAARAGLAGVVGEAGRLLVLDRSALIEMADDLGLFVLGVDPEAS